MRHSAPVFMMVEIDPRKKIFLCVNLYMHPSRKSLKAGKVRVGLATLNFPYGLNKRKRFVDKKILSYNLVINKFMTATNVA